MQFFYSLSIKSYYYAIKVASLFGNQKAKKWLLGRVNWAENLKKTIPANSTPYWFHVASLGEFEQAIPIIEKVKKNIPQQFILLTFFSPSGYEVKKEYPLADHICYLPLDSKVNAKTFIQIVKPKKAFFIKYEFWFNFLLELERNKIETFLISGIFRPGQHFFKPYGKWFQHRLKAFTYFLLQNAESKELLKSIGLINTTISGDTRLDRVLKITQEEFEDTSLQTFSKNAQVIVFGSSWEKEHNIALQLHNSNPNYKIIIAPHQINNTTINNLSQKFETSVKIWSKLEKGETLENCRILIIDTIGLLSKIYRYGNFAFIGGGFGNGIHNILEPLAYTIPVFFGPKFQKFQEAIDSIQKGIGFSINHIEELKKHLTYFSENPREYNIVQEKIQTYLSSNSGATKKIMKVITDS